MNCHARSLKKPLVSVGSDPLANLTYNEDSIMDRQNDILIRLSVPHSHVRTFRSATYLLVDLAKKREPYEDVLQLINLMRKIWPECDEDAERVAK
jgi:hypothetical protein